MYRKSGFVDGGYLGLVFTRMPLRDIVSWNSMSYGLSQNGQGNEEIDLFEEMQIECMNPNYVTFVNVLISCSHMRIAEIGWSCFNKMVDEYGVTPRIEHYSYMVDLLSRSGKLNKARDFIESISSIDHGVCLWGILLIGCRNYDNYELGHIWVIN